MTSTSRALCLNRISMILLLLMTAVGFGLGVSLRHHHDADRPKSPDRFTENHHTQGTI